MAGLQLVTEHQRPPAGAAEKPSWDYLFARATGTVHPSQKAAAALQDACLAQGDMVILSIEGALQHHCCRHLSSVAQVGKGVLDARTAAILLAVTMQIGLAVQGATRAWAGA